MLNRVCAVLAQWVLGLRYRVRVVGMKEVATKGSRGILFLANHPALIDPPILCSRLVPGFAVRPLANEEGLRRPGIGVLARRMRTIPVPRMETAEGADSERTEDSLVRVQEALRAGENVLLYPAGRIYRSRREECQGNSAVERIVAAVPQARVVLVRTTGLWGSRFSMAHGDVPSVRRILRLGVRSLLLNGLFFMPRRRVTIDLHEPSDFPRNEGRKAINDTLEVFFNQAAPAALEVPCTRWEGPAREFSDPSFGAGPSTVAVVPASIQADVRAVLSERSGVAEFADTAELGRDLGFDSLAKMEVVAWLSERFGVADVEGASLQTVGDVMLAACGQGSSEARSGLKPMPHGWFRACVPAPDAAAWPETLPDALFQRARRHADMVIAADQISGTKTYRQLVRDAVALSMPIARWPERNVAVLLPASVGALTTYFAILLAGKTPVMLNWTVGRRNVQHALDTADVHRILTTEAVLQRLDKYDGALAADVRNQATDITELAGALSLHERLRALRHSWTLCPPRLGRPRLSSGDPAVILFTSGSEAAPKAVPLTHGNLLANAKDIAAVLPLEPGDRVAGILPPFHSFGLLGTMVLPTVLSVPTVYHPNPMHGATIAALIRHSGASILMGTPTFVAGILRRTGSGQLDTLRWVVTGAEACPDDLHRRLAEAAPQAQILEGYGITECSPVVALNPPKAPRPGTVGRPMQSLSHAIVSDDVDRCVAPGGEGRLLLRGPSVFHGYLGGDSTGAFVRFEGKTWYDTGDRVRLDDDGHLHFRGRRKRFVKVGGEMVSLPAIEALLRPLFPSSTDGAPTLAVEAQETGMRPEIILFSTRADVDRETVNAALRSGGLSALHNIQRVHRLETIPTLGTGKTDHNALRALAASA